MTIYGQTANLEPTMSDSSALKTLLMGGAAVVAIIIAIVVAVKTFSDPSISAVNPPTEPISGNWALKQGLEASEIPQGAPPEYMIANEIVGFDASTVDSGTVTIATADGSLAAKVMNSQPGHLLLQVKTKAGKTTQLTIAQMGEGGPAVVTDGITTSQFERKP